MDFEKTRKLIMDSFVGVFIQLRTIILKTEFIPSFDFNYCGGITEVKLLIDSNRLKENETQFSWIEAFILLFCCCHFYTFIF